MVPEHWSHERIALLLYLGADVVVSPGGMVGAMERARAIAADTPGAVLLDQFSSLIRRSTGEPLPRGWADTPGPGGLVRRRRRNRWDDRRRGSRSEEPRSEIRVVAVEPAESAVLSGGSAGEHAIQGIRAGFIPPLFRVDLVDEVSDCVQRGRVRVDASPGARGGHSCGRFVGRHGLRCDRARLSEANGEQAHRDDRERLRGAHVTTPRLDALPRRRGRR